MEDSFWCGLIWGLGFFGGLGITGGLISGLTSLKELLDDRRNKLIKEAVSAAIKEMQRKK